MGNKGAFITLNGKDMKPEFTTYEAVVSISVDHFTHCKFLTVFFVLVSATSQRKTNGIC